MKDLIADNIQTVFWTVTIFGFVAGAVLTWLGWQVRRRPFRASVAVMFGALLLGAAAWLVFGGPLRSYRPGFDLQGRTGIDLSSYTFTTVNDGVSHNLEEYHGRPVLIYYWSTACGPCRPTLPVLDQIAEEFGERAAIILLSYQDPETLRTFAVAHAIRGIVATAPKAPVTTNEYPEYLPTPTTFLVDREGIVRRVMIAQRTPKHLRALLEKYAGSNA